MPGEKSLEKPIIDNIELPLQQTEKIKNSEQKLEQVSSVFEKISQKSDLLKKLENKHPIMPLVNSSFQQQRAVAIDVILSAGLNEIFLHLKAEEQQAFKKKGEETVTKINELLNKIKLKISTIINLIRDWLKLIPGVNKFFLEQEAKIKANQILKIKDKF